MEVVTAIKAELARQIEPERFKLWFESCTRFEMDDGSLSVRVPNRFYQDFIRRNYQSQLRAASLSVVGIDLVVDFVVDAELARLEAASDAADTTADAVALKQSTGSANGRPRAPARPRSACWPGASG